MFFKNALKMPQKSKKTFKFDVFNAKINKNEENSNFNQPAVSYNFSLDKSVLSNGYGLKELQMPTSKTDLESEEKIEIVGKVKRMWSFTWYDGGNDKLNYYLFYFNDSNNIIYENLFNLRPFRLTIPTNYTETPVGLSYRINSDDYMIFSTKTGQVYVHGSGYNKYLENAPKLIGLCNHDERVFALTSAERHSLVYSDDADIFQWQDDGTKHIDFSDERGNLNKVVSFNDYLYIFRDYGITRLSNFSMEGDYSVRHLYLSTSYIYPGSIAYDGDYTYFMTDDGFYRFDGNNVRKIELDIKDLSFRDCACACYEGKYFLSCRKEFADLVGCESGDYKNNIILIFDTATQTTQFIRGVDVNQILPLLNPYKSKLVVCFNGQNEGKIAELTDGGSLLDQSALRVWESVKTNFGLGNTVKKLECFFIKTSSPVTITFIGDDDQKTFVIEGSDAVQRIKCGLAFKFLRTRIESQSEQIKISNFEVEVSA